MQCERDEVAILAQSVAKALKMPIGERIGTITDALLEVQRLTYEHAIEIIGRQPDPINKIRTLATAAAEARSS